MSRYKQIEEMAKGLHRNRCGGCGEELCEYKIPTNDEFSCIDYKMATALYNEGYRKASEVAEEIFAEIEEKGKVDEPIVEYYILSYSELAELKKKYTVTDTNVGGKDTEDK